MEGAHKYVFARAFRAPFPAHGWVFMLLLPSVLHPWLLSALTELGTPSPLRHEATALLCWALGRGTGSPFILAGWKGSLGVSSAGSEPQHVLCGDPGHGGEEKCTATAQIQTNCPLPCMVDLFTPNTHLYRT